MRLHALLLAVTLLCACRVTRPSDLPSNEPWIVAVKSCGLPTWMPWYTRFAEHTWVDYKCGEESAWRRAEVTGARSGATDVPISAASARRDLRWQGETVRVEEVLVGSRAEAIARQIEQVTGTLSPRYQNGGYQAWPGPNSNTFVRELAREIPELAFRFDHNAVGKDYAWFDAGPAPSRTGVQFDTWPLGFTLAAAEGLELHLLQLSMGMRLWPPRLQLPFLPPIPWESGLDPAQQVASLLTPGVHFMTYPLENHESPDISVYGFHSMTRTIADLTPGEAVMLCSGTGECSLLLRVLDTPPLAGDAPTARRIEAIVDWRGESRFVFVCGKTPGDVFESPELVLERATVTCKFTVDEHGSVDSTLLIRTGP